MANEENNTSGKVIKERTVKKKAARSIVAPKADEEVSGREARRRESFDAMNKSRQPVIERESRVIKSPGSMKVREEPGKGAKMVTAPIQLTWNEDTLLPSSGKTVKKPATGWPETPPVPKNKGKEKPKEKPQSPKKPENAQSLPRIPETSEAAKEVTGKLPDIKEELQRGNLTQ